MYNPTLSEIMTIDVVAINPEDTMERVDELFRNHSFHHLPVVNKNKEVVGIISKSDYLMLCNQRTLFLKDKERKHNLHFFRSLLVEEVMSKPVAKLNSDSKISVAVGFFRENLFHAIPVVNDKDQLIGIVTTLDLINYAYNTLDLLSLEKAGINQSNKYP